MATAQRCNPTLGTPAVPMGAGEDGGPSRGQGVPARPGGGAGSSLQPQEGPQGPGALGGSGVWLSHLVILPKPGWSSGRGLRCRGTLDVPSVPSPALGGF